ncbi:MAG: helix-hairpin-helix domain-containing protein [Clostridium sp.]
MYKIKRTIHNIFLKLKKIDKEYLIIGGILLFILIFGIYSYFTKNMKNVEENIDVAMMQKQEKEEVDSKNIYVHLDGMIKKPGLYEVVEGARLKEVIDKAGGLTEKANIKLINFALKVADGEKIYIPSVDDKEGKDDVDMFNNQISEEDKGANTNVSSANRNISYGNNTKSNAQSGNKNSSIKKKVDINKGSKEDLIKINGIGEQMADKIIEYRKEHGKFNSIEEIKEVKGIGEAKYSKIKYYIIVK